MSETARPTTDFLSQVFAVIEQHLANEQFGVSELADAMSMSRSNLLRKVKKDSNLSVSQLISQIRLTRAMELLRNSSMNVSEVSHQVGFNSPSYFIKCFREHYGYPPGEVGNQTEGSAQDSILQAPVKGNTNAVKWAAIGVLAVTIMAAATLYIYKVWPFAPILPAEKSIAVLPFKNESNDSTNVYLINGLMESTLGNLQKIKDLRVISRTSSEKYRSTSKSIPEMAKELNVTYFVEGSGQKIGDQILLNIQLIEGSTDRHLWSSQYKRETKDIFKLQQEIARSISEEIQAIITTDEAKRIAKKPTEDLVAYDLFLKGKNLQTSGRQNLDAIGFFDKAIRQDPKFALAYAEVAITYYYLDIFKAEKKYTNDINSYADKAMLYDPKLGESLVAKAMSFMSKKEFKSAAPYLEKALEYNPNSASVIGFLSDFYGNYMMNTGKYLEYALKGVQLDIAAMDSVQASYTYLRLANALIQTGFVDESLKYIDKSLDYNPQNPFSRYIRAYILYAKAGDPRETQKLLLVEFNKDTTRFDILQDIGKITYYMKDYQASYKYYQRFLKMIEKRKLDVYRHENMIISYVYAKVGQKQKSEELLKSYKAFLDTDQSLYHDLLLTGYFVSIGDQRQAVEHMRLFSKEDNVQYWIILFLESDPSLEPMTHNAEFMKYFNEAKARFWRQHDELKEVLNRKGLIAD